MENIWAKKEGSFANRKSHSNNVFRYIPKKYYVAIDDAFTDSDGYWIYLKNGFAAYDGGEDCGVIHEYNIQDLKDAIKTIRSK